MTAIKKPKSVKIIRKGRVKFFCDAGVDEHKDLLSQGCRRASEVPDLIVK